MANKKNKKPASYQFTPYSGAKPYAPQYSAASEKALYDTILPRSQGVGVGYDPAWLAENTSLLKSQLGQQEEDQLRGAQGQISASGLSGNPRAYEALAGRVKRDTGRQLADSMSKINIADLERKNQERDVNTGRLQNFMGQEFSQGNDVANFDAGIYGTEESLKRGAAQDALTGYQFDKNQSDEFLNSLLQAGATAAGMYFGGPAGASIGSQSAQALTGSGKGIAPSYQEPYVQPLNKTRAYRALAGR